MYTRLFSTFCAIILLASCGGNSGEPSPADNTKDRQAILIHWADNIIVPSYGNFKTKFDAFKVASDAFTATPNTTTLTTLRSAWVDAYAEWQKVELFEFGPADQVTLRNFFNIYPADLAGIEANINDASAALDVPSAYARQGFPAMDYLINGVDADDDAIVSFYTDGTHGAKRTAYVNKLTTRMNTLLTTVINSWKGTGRDAFISKTGLDIGSSMGLVVNAYVLHYERYIRSGKIGIPSGSTIASGGVAYPEKVEAYYKKDISKMLAKNAHQAAADFFNGKSVNASTDALSFKSYLDALGSKDAGTGTLLTTIINKQFALINTKLDALQPDFIEQIETNNAAMSETYATMQKMVSILKVDMTSAMSITITYTDNDGD